MQSNDFIGNSHQVLDVPFLPDYSVAHSCENDPYFVFTKYQVNLGHISCCNWQDNEDVYDAFTKLKAQAIALGGKVDNCEAHDFDGGLRGMIATEDMLEGDLIIYIPHSLLLTDDIAF